MYCFSFQPLFSGTFIESAESLMLLILSGHFNYGTGKLWLKVIYNARLCQQQNVLFCELGIHKPKIHEFSKSCDDI